MTSIQSGGTVAGWQGAAELRPLVKNWWMIAGRGVVAVLFGIVMAFWRVPVLDALVVAFATYAVVDGLLAIASAMRAGRSRIAGWPVALEGLVSVGLGALALTWPIVPQQVFLVLATWGLLTGVLEIIAALRLPRHVAAHWFLTTAGVSSIFLALVVVALPRAGSERVALTLAAYAIVFGIVMVLAALRFRFASRRLAASAAAR